MGLVLSGDQNNFSQDLKDAEVNHLRRLLAWLRCEYTLDEDMQRGFLQGAQMCASDPAARPRVQQIVDEKAAQIAHVPAYIRQAVKMLTKAVRDHDAKTHVVQP